MHNCAKWTVPGITVQNCASPAQLWLAMQRFNHPLPPLSRQLFRPVGTACIRVALAWNLVATGPRPPCWCGGVFGERGQCSGCFQPAGGSGPHCQALQEWRSRGCSCILTFRVCLCFPGMPSVEKLPPSPTRSQGSALPTGIPPTY